MSYRHIRKIFIANRGEIAHRIIRTASRIGVSTVVPVIRGEQETLPAKAADEIHLLDSSLLNETYLDAKYMVQLALLYGADAVHPGYGFLSESAPFAEMVENAGLLWIGPAPASIAAMGNKLTARRIAGEAGVSVSNALEGDIQEILKNESQLKYPLLIKSASGGGGKGMRIARNRSELKDMLTKASREAYNYFNDPTVYVEEYIESPRHIEVQVLGDQHGSMVHLFERECSIQRRYQKIIEEAPSPFVTDDLRHKLTSDALRLCKQIGYYNAGTVEFLVDASGHHYFLEMNTRLQVEHPITEAITNIDIVEEQINIAAGLPLSFSQRNITIHRHAIEARLYAEDAQAEFSPAPGKIEFVEWGDAETVRTDTFFNHPIEIQSQFDPLLAKIIADGINREAAIAKLAEGLRQTSLLGVTSNLPYLMQIIKLEAFKHGETTTHFIPKHQQVLQKDIHPNGTEKSHLLLAAYTAWLVNFRTRNTGSIWKKLGHKRWNGSHDVTLNEHCYRIKIQSLQPDGFVSWQIDKQEMLHLKHIHLSENHLSFFYKDQFRKLSWHNRSNGELLFGIDGYTYIIQPGYFRNIYKQPMAGENEEISSIKAPMPGKIIKTAGLPGDKVEKGSVLLVLEAMKMENSITANAPGILKAFNVKEGEQVKAGQLLVEINRMVTETESTEK